ncbi:MAG: acetyl-CoA carboxylase carboxyl transferase subunit alpha, partial [Chitinophagaceae bacterium]|nr:acetyl-CoA carboxylase carboxyl transferase subunit alpha [Chitinophagaceae bacterium]
MPQNSNRQFIDFEKPLKELIEEILDLEQKTAKGKVDYSEVIAKLNEQVLEKRKDLTKNLSSWQRVQL